MGYGVEAAVQQRLIDDFEPESQRLYRDLVARRVFPERTGYVVTTADREFPPALQRRYAAALGSGPVHEIPAGHLPMLQEPGRLTRIIEEFA